MNGMESYFESGVYTFNTDNSFGCDSVATIYLTINYPNNSTDTVIACDSYEWNGEVYNEAAPTNIQNKTIMNSQ